MDMGPIHLLYADIVMLFFQMQDVLKWTFYTLNDLTQEELLEISYSRAKVMAFAKYLRTHVWQLNNHLIKQVKTFKYLRIVFHIMGNMPAIAA